jgi:hypothetical protein
MAKVIIADCLEFSNQKVTVITRGFAATRATEGVPRVAGNSVIFGMRRENDIKF